MSLLAFLVHPVQMTRYHILLLPLLAAVAVVYKTIRVRDLRNLPLQIFILWAYMAAGLVGLAAALYVLADHIG